MRIIRSVVSSMIAEIQKPRLNEDLGRSDCSLWVEKIYDGEKVSSDRSRGGAGAGEPKCVEKWTASELPGESLQICVGVGQTS